MFHLGRNWLLILEEGKFFFFLNTMFNDLYKDMDEVATSSIKYINKAKLITLSLRIFYLAPQSSFPFKTKGRTVGKHKLE